MTIKLSSDMEASLLLGPSSITIQCPLEGLTVVAIKRIVEESCCCSSCGRDIIVRIVAIKQSSGKTFLELSWTCLSTSADRCLLYDKWVVNTPPTLRPTRDVLV